MAKTKYVAAQPVAFGYPPDGSQPQEIRVFETGEVVPQADEFPNLEGLIANGYLQEGGGK